MKFYWLRYLDPTGSGGGGNEKEALLASIKKQVADELNTRGYTSKTEVDGLIAEKLKQYEGLDIEGLRGLQDAVKTMAAEIDKVKTTRTEEEKPLSLRAQIEDWQKRNQESLDKIKNGTRVDLPVMHLRAPATMTIGTSLNGSAYLPNVQVAPGVVDLVRNQPTFWDYLRKGRTNANPYVWVNKVNKEGNAQFIGEGVLKPLASFQLETETSNPKKAAERMKVSTELLNDSEGIETMIRDELRYEVEMAANTAVLTGVASATSPAGITTLASAYTLTSIQTPNPNNADAIRAAIAQLRSLNFTQNIVAFVNPIDAANMDLSKAVDSGVYMLPPFTTADGRRIAGVPVIEDNNIAVGYLLIGDMSKYRILIHQDFFIAWGWENDDFSKNLVTVIGEIRFHQFMSSNHVGAFIYDTFANIKTAITPPAAP